MNPLVSIHRNLLQDDNNTISKTIQSPSHSPPSYKPYSPFNSTITLTVLVLLTILLFITFFSFYIRHFSSSSNPPDPSNELPRPRPRTKKHTGLKSSDIRRIPVVLFGGEMKVLNECSICLSEFEEGEFVKVIPFCNHGFHPTCIDTWLSSHVSCPLCRSTELFLAVDEEMKATCQYTSDE